MLLLDRAGSESSKPAVNLLNLLSIMMTARACDRREAILIRQDKGWFHIAGAGHEAIAAIADLLGPSDLIFPTYRDRALMLARGYTVDAMAAEFLGKSGSHSEGRNLPGHYCSRELNVFSIASPIGIQCLPAVGAAWSAKLRNTSDVVICTIGDAGTRQGEFYEAVCMAMQESLPIVFIVEDNGIGISTRTERMLPMRLGVFSASLIERIDGRQCDEVRSAAQHAILKARAGGGPTILWAELDRLASHTSSDDQRMYRSAEELAALPARDPITLLKQQIVDRLLATTAELDQIEADTARAVDQAYASAESLPVPDLSVEGIGAPGPAATAVVAAPSGPMTMVEAFNLALRALLDLDPRTLVFGEDVEDPKGGVFGYTRGLSTEFPQRVRNSPLAEATIVGAAVGLAATGFRPIFEIQFIDFVFPGLDQLSQQAATLNWRTNGQWTCPAVFYATYGAYTAGSGPWHSQSNESIWTHFPGLKVVVPSTPDDAFGLLLSAAADPDPVLILIPKGAARMKAQFAGTPVPLGSAAIRRAGTDLTIVAWGNCVRLSLEAADRLAQTDISAEVVDLRTLAPLDEATIAESLTKTGHLLVVQEDMLGSSFGEALIGSLLAQEKSFYSLLEHPTLVSRPHVHVPYHAELDRALMPDTNRIVEAARQLMGR